MKTQGLAEKKPLQTKSDKLPASANLDPNSSDKAELSLRSERAEFLRTVRKERRELNEAIKTDQFLRDWLRHVEQDQRAFAIEREKLCDPDLTEIAHHAGFRTSKAWLAARKDLEKLHHYFVYAEPFKELWAHLRERQDKIFPQWGYSPTRVGVPHKLVDAVMTWHQAPKFTQAERRAHSRKIAAACEVLEDLLGQIEPSHTLDGQYSRFRFDNKAQAGALCRAFDVSHEKDDKDPFFGTQWKASHRLQLGGVVPLWAIQNIKKMAAEGGPKASPLPAKIRAKAAKKTYFIGAVSGILKSVSFSNPADSQIGHQLIADVVGLLAGTDCTADDVRKATK